ncbi:MAG: hypothetical protein RBQ99_10005 [Trichlorobacter sp.]|nr:hypothetical protein [Trichlorobacter sp.]
MIIISKKHASDEALDTVKEFLVNKGFDIHQSTGADRTIIGVIGSTATIDEQLINSMDGVHQVVRIKPEDE